MRPLLLLGLSVLFVAAGGWFLFGGADDVAADDPSLLANRVWAERAPLTDRDMVLYFIPLKLGKRQVGVMQRASKFAYAGQRLGWSRKGKELSLTLPQRQRTAKLGVRTWRCGKEAPEGFDLCLELVEGDRKVRLYSKSRWPRADDGPVAELPATWSPALLGAHDWACEGCPRASLERLTSP